MILRTAYMFKTQRRQVIVVSILISFLILIANIFFAAITILQNYSSNLRDRLGLNIYIQNELGGNTTSVIIPDIIADLTDAGFDANFISSERGINSLRDQYPIVGNLINDDIPIILPDRIMISTPNPEQGEQLGEILSTYQEYISNRDAVVDDENDNSDANNGILRIEQISQQQARTQEAVSKAQSNIIISIILISMLGVTILAFLCFVIFLLFTQFHKQIEVEKLVGAGYGTIMQPFLGIITIIISLSSGLATGYIITGIRLYETDIANIYNITLSNVFTETVLVGQRGFLLLFGLIVSSLTTNHLIRRV